ncbi:PadR family transcriptional regulator [Pimelobacter simplex]|uniref:PadR family transcriptional regulator n=1 Tax=Nocardioides simplex TaxID=2045 RepID=A0A7J5E2W9_NOCSI|nr:PadR family transcriptional regulator [Pimelobacter simplex]KAB2812620.1 PadR family transcriptional regulator [Pimelobacter simplex]
MAAHDTRLLLLGAVALFEPVNGYQIRRELMSWQVDQWAHVNPGSIYSGLSTLTKQGHLVRHDLVDGGREVAVYELTASGRTELDRLVEVALTTVDLYDAVGLHVALGLLPLIDRPTAVRHLSARLRALDDLLPHLEGVAGSTTAPPHATRSMALPLLRGRAERAWLVEMLDDVRSGQLFFRDEPFAWAPTQDDPGWQMNADRERYRALLGR